MKIIKLAPQGFCYGVSRALDIVKNALNNPKVVKPIYILGLIIHNEHVKNHFNELGVISLDEYNSTRIDLLKKIVGGTVILTAHGSSPEVYHELKRRSLPFIDATCPDVKRVHERINASILANHTVIYIGKCHHPESEGALGISSDILFVTDINDVDKLPKIDNDIYVTNQTTLSFHDLFLIVEAIKKRYTNVFFESDICSATTKRQDAVINQIPVDLMYVVGDYRSSNANRLVHVGNNQAKIKSILIANAADIQVDDLIGIKSISVTSAASTPKVLVDEVISYLNQF